MSFGEEDGVVGVPPEGAVASCVRSVVNMVGAGVGSPGGSVVVAVRTNVTHGFILGNYQQKTTIEVMKW